MRAAARAGAFRNIGIFPHRDGGFRRVTRENKHFDW